MFVLFVLIYKIIFENIDFKNTIFLQLQYSTSYLNPPSQLWRIIQIIIVTNQINRRTLLLKSIRIFITARLKFEESQNCKSQTLAAFQTQYSINYTLKSCYIGEYTIIKLKYNENVKFKMSNSLWPYNWKCWISLLSKLIDNKISNINNL